MHRRRAGQHTRAPGGLAAAGGRAHTHSHSHPLSHTHTYSTHSLCMHMRSTEHNSTAGRAAAGGRAPPHNRRAPLVCGGVDFLKLIDEYIALNAQAQRGAQAGARVWPPRALLSMRSCGTARAPRTGGASRRSASTTSPGTTTPTPRAARRTPRPSSRPAPPHTPRTPHTSRTPRAQGRTLSSARPTPRIARARASTRTRAWPLRGLPSMPGTSRGGVGR